MKQTSRYSRSSLWFYVPLWFFFVYLYFQILNFKADQANDFIIGGLYFVEFGIHEASHLATMFLPPILCALAGSLGEVTFTWLLVYASLKAKSYFAAIFSLLWVALSMKSVGNYISDARAQSLPLIGPGPEPTHDWNFILGQLGWLEWDKFIGGTVSLIGAIAGLVGLIIGLALIINMATSQPTTETKPIGS